MKANKLTLKDQFLSLEQAKDLQELGVDIYGNFEIDIDDNGFETIEKVGTFASDTFEYYKKSIPTLSVAEMIEILTPIENGYALYVERSFDSYYACYKDYDKYILTVHNSKCESRNELLRDTLFEMLKWLKQNKMSRKV